MAKVNVEVEAGQDWTLYARNSDGYTELLTGTGPGEVDVDHELAEDENFMVIPVTG